MKIEASFCVWSKENKNKSLSPLVANVTEMWRLRVCSTATAGLRVVCGMYITLCLQRDKAPVVLDNTFYYH